MAVEGLAGLLDRLPPPRTKAGVAADSTGLIPDLQAKTKARDMRRAYPETLWTKITRTLGYEELLQLWGRMQVLEHAEQRELNGS